MNKANQAAEGLQKLKDVYRDRLPEKLDALSADWELITTDGWQEDIARQVHAVCHQLTGTGETFGFPGVTHYSRIAEKQLNNIFDSHEPPGDKQLKQLDVAIRELIEKGPVAHQQPDSTDAIQLDSQTMRGSDPADQEQTQAGSASRVQPLSTLPIYVVEDDESLADHIVMELALQGYDARAIYDPAELERTLRRGALSPGAIIMDIIFPDAITGGIDTINQVRRDHILKAPVIFISAGDSFSTRLEVVRAGGDAFFAKPLDVQSLIEKLESLIGETDPDPLRILIVDDDDIATGVICLVLEEAGLRAEAINDPKMVIDKVLEFRPDLVILDMYMPEVNGMDVAQVLRQHESCGNLPLLFLSSESDPGKKAAALNIGVDDFLVKPVDHEYLISAVANRAQRARAMGTRISRDGLTHLLVRNEIKSQLAGQLSSAQRGNRKLSYIILDLDNFKRINETCGHLTGDHVIKSLTGLMRRSFRRSDILGRYGGGEFVVIMQDTGIADAAIVLDRVRHEFSQTGHKSELGGNEFFATFSAGISSFPEFGEIDALETNASRALYEAKKLGRNRICQAACPE